jgi:hypothetical protein
MKGRYGRVSLWLIAEALRGSGGQNEAKKINNFND